MRSQEWEQGSGIRDWGSGERCLLAIHIGNSLRLHTRSYNSSFLTPHSSFFVGEGAEAVAFDAAET
jgi:hypothetical protein